MKTSTTILAITAFIIIANADAGTAFKDEGDCKYFTLQAGMPENPYNISIYCNPENENTEKVWGENGTLTGGKPCGLAFDAGRPLGSETIGRCNDAIKDGNPADE